MSTLPSKRATPRRTKHPITPPGAMEHNRVKDGVFRDLAYMKAIASQAIPCAITGLYGDDTRHVVPAHVGVAGKGIKSPDNEVIPMLDHLHRASHSQVGQGGDTTFWCEVFMKDPLLLRDVLKAYARERHAEYKSLAMEGLENG